MQACLPGTKAAVAAIMSNDAVIETARALDRRHDARHPALTSTALGRSGAKIAHLGTMASERSLPVGHLIKPPGRRDKQCRL